MYLRVKVKKLEHAAGLPCHATAHSSGVDLLAANFDHIIIMPREIKVIPTGISIALPANFEAQIRPRSGLAAKHGITVLNSPGTIDADYRGEIKVILINHGCEDFLIERGMKIAQMVFSSYNAVIWEEISSHDQTKRGEGGFGSTGD